MGRYRSRSRSYSPSPRRRSRTPPPPRRKRYDEPRQRYHQHHERRSPAPCGLLVRNVSLDTRPEDLRIPFEKYGPVKDVYLPRNYYTGEPRGFAFVKFRFAEDAAEAKDRLNHTIIGGREIRIVYAEENRKTPQEMRKDVPTSGRYGGRRTSPRSSRRRNHSYSRSPVSRRHHSRSVSRSQSPRSGRYYQSTGRSLSPRDHSPDKREGRTRGRFRSPKEISPRDEKGHTSTRRVSNSTRTSPHDEDSKLSRRSPSSREISPRNRKNFRSSGRSISPRMESPLAKDCKEKQRACGSGEVSSPDEGCRPNKGSLSPQEIPMQDDRRGTSSQKIPSSKDVSSDYEKGHSLNHRSKNPGENGSSPLRGGELASSSLVSPRMKGRSVSPSRSQSYSPR